MKPHQSSAHYDKNLYAKKLAEIADEDDGDGPPMREDAPKGRNVPETDDPDRQPSQSDDGLGNATGKPRSEKSINAIVEELNFQEATTRDSPYWADSYRKPYNPDDLVMRRQDYSTYDREMINDDQVSICLELKKDLVLGSGYEFICEDGDDPAADEMAETMRRDLEVAFAEDPEIDIEQSFSELLVAYEIGFSLTEKTWKIREDGSKTIKHLKTRHPSTWLIHTDEFGNVEKYEQRTPKGAIAVKPTSLIHYVNNPRYQNPYGRSDLRAAYDAWFIKREIIKFYAIFLEKNASPTPVARYDTKAPPAAVTEIYNAIKKFQTKTAICIPKNIEIEFLESKSNGEAYIRGINIFNMFIGRALFIPDLLGFQGSETSGGSYALGKDQMAVLHMHIRKRRAHFEKLINMQLVKPFILNNYGLVDRYPKFRLKEVSDDKTEVYARLWIEAVKGKFYEPSDEEVNFFRKMIRFPTGAVERAAEPVGLPNPFAPAKLEEDPTNDEKEDEGEDGSGKSSRVGKPFPGPNALEKEKEGYAKAFDGTPGDYARKTNFKLLKSGLDTGFAKIMDEGKPLIREIYDDLFAQIRDKKIVQKQDISKIEAIKVKKLAALKTLLKRRFKEWRADAYKQATGEIVKGAQKYTAPLPHEDFLAFLEEETFQYIGDFEYNIKKKVRLALIDAIKDGKPLSSVLDVLDDEGVALSTTSLERFARTKLTEVMNRGRKEAFEETGVVAAYQFSAIMDDRVSDVCGGLHGSIFEAAAAPTPPLHFNCRSVLIPITKYEEYKVTKSVEGMNMDKFIDDNIGDGFSRQ